MISNEQTKLASKVSASLHPTTGNLRLSVLKDGLGWAHHFFAGQEDAVTFLLDALDLVDPEAVSVVEDALEGSDANKL